ncbi:hypothetical protein CWM47_18590 [Spirosoma pollinicola]|uniref:Uncharacterized protein n=2 Tax=Spirosoma pollinicola TaxID=2057025 RepID=A0A2K8Z1A1_9BACT|nr:hypothetical protein CWM47_18590 [Spirosoma pollinicola]
MTDKNATLSYSPFNPANPPNTRPKSKYPYEQESRKPDWLLLLISAIVLLTLLIAWLAGIPGSFYQ